ncbi:hypothetical protein KABACHOK_00190 [Brevundimonas phage vB_BpoS-Kabachok]|uniref:Uncharacterized protein n=1 Tax=Brevundimonas phage vB_BpoS-Kabachok TaxID=2948600 RepID=A0A9E7SJQ0_9CAUD|nr:hypothetical protein KABACHOK_00190 [Brevundimonas phage vB_BpoS-Kabachok]
MTQKTREQHAALIQYLHDDMMKADYFRSRASLSVRDGIVRALELGLKGCLSEGAFCQLAVRELMGLALGARMNNGTPRTQAVVNFIEWAGMIAWCSQGRSYGTPEERKRLDYLFEVQERGEFFISGVTPETVLEPARFTGIVGVQKEPTDTPGMLHSWVVIYPEDGSDAIRLNAGQELGLRRHERVSYAVIEGKSGQRYATAIRPCAPRKPLPNSTYDACGQADGAAPEMENGFFMHVGDRRFVATIEGKARLIPIQSATTEFPNGTRVQFRTRFIYGCERVVTVRPRDQAETSSPESKRGILIRSAGQVFVMTQESNYQNWIAVAGDVSFPDTMGAVTYRLERAADGHLFAVEIEAAA